MSLVSVAQQVELCARRLQLPCPSVHRCTATMSSRKRPRRPSFDSGSGSGSGSGSDSSDAEAEGMPEPSVSKKARRLSVSGSESDNNSGSDSDAESGSGSSSGGGSDSGSDGGDSDADSVGSFAAAAYAPRSFTRVSAPGLPLHDAVTSADTELWLFRVPVDVRSDYAGLHARSGGSPRWMRVLAHPAVRHISDKQEEAEDEAAQTHTRCHGRPVPRRGGRLRAPLQHCCWTRECSGTDHQPVC